MGLMSLAEIRAELHLLSGQRSEIDPDTTLGKARLNRWINNALRWVCIPKVFKHPALHLQQDIVLDVDQTDQQYALADDLEFIDFVRNIDTLRRYTPQQPREFMDRSGGDQRTYSRRGDFIFLRANSGNTGETVRVFYYGRPELLTLDGQKTTLHEWWDQVIVQKAGFYSWAILGNLAAADFYRESAAALANDARDALNYETHDTGWRNDVQGD